MIIYNLYCFYWQNYGDRLAIIGLQDLLASWHHVRANLSQKLKTKSEGEIFQQSLKTLTLKSNIEFLRFKAGTDKIEKIFMSKDI